MDNEQNSTKTNINWYPGHMAKTKRLIKEKSSQIDVVYEVLDARMPYSSKIRDTELLSDKPHILVFTKMDLCDVSVTKEWIVHYEKQGYTTVCLDLNQTNNLKPLFQLTKKLMQEKNQKRIEKGMNIRKTRVLIVGIPNVGKSTLINRLVGKQATNVGNLPGVTKELSWIRINEELELLDSPGILWPKLAEGNVALNLATFTAIREEILPIYEVCEYFLRTLETYYPKLLEERYGITQIAEDMTDTLEIIGKKRGCLLKGGEIDYDKVVLLVLNDVKTGKIKQITFDRLNP